MNGSPMEYNFCDLEFIDVKVNLDATNLQVGGCETRERFWKIDEVLELVASEFSYEWQRKPVPDWEMLLSFLYREGDTHGACSFGEANVGQYVRMVDDEIRFANLTWRRICWIVKVRRVRWERKKMMDLITLRNLTWSLFRKSVYDQFETDLLEVYYAMEGSKSKKLKFLKCRMKQMKKSGCSGKANCKLNDLPHNGEQPISSFASAEIDPEPEASRMQEQDVLDFRSETSETFFNNVADRINRGSESEVVDMGALAEEIISKSQSPLKDHNVCDSMIASELIKLLLREPKEIAAKHKSQNPSSKSQILQSEVGSGVEDSWKQKFVKQTCLLLENIQCHMEVGFFGDWTLEKYVTKIIKHRCNFLHRN
ncbi:hypothetical protein E2542_SST04599 [Spatholobus suberectus]|nr:hypothetical protein E2542_SST04599 [Spatholobus suberectus]